MQDQRQVLLLQLLGKTTPMIVFLSRELLFSTVLLLPLPDRLSMLELLATFILPVSNTPQKTAGIRMTFHFFGEPLH